MTQVLVGYRMPFAEGPQGAQHAREGRELQPTGGLISVRGHADGAGERCRAVGLFDRIVVDKASFGLVARAKSGLGAVAICQVARRRARDSSDRQPVAMRRRATVAARFRAVRDI
jgi:hypothetical protein